MRPFYECDNRPPSPEMVRQLSKKLGLPEEAAERYLRDEWQQIKKIYRNNKYQVAVYDVAAKDPEAAPMIWLSIKRLDKKPIHDWRELQKIKNAIVGPECEGVEIYPAESRLVDTANQYHLWVISDPTFRWPFGLDYRAVVGKGFNGAVQRPFDEPTDETAKLKEIADGD